MSESEYLANSVLEAVPLFPLPEVVLFPDTLLPLHIFEPRYRQMTRDVLAGQKQLCVAQITGHSPLDHPPVSFVCGLGEVVDHRALPDGRYHLLVLGKARVQLDELPFKAPYRRARAKVLASVNRGVDNSDIAALIAMANRANRIMKEHSKEFDFTLPSSGEPGQLADACAAALVMDPGERQGILEQLDCGARVRRCTEALAVQEALLKPGRLLS